MEVQQVNDKKLSKQTLVKNRRSNKIAKNIKKTLKNKIIKENHKKARRTFKNSVKENLENNFRNYVSTTDILSKKNIINKAKANKLKSKIYKQYTIQQSSV